MKALTLETGNNISQSLKITDDTHDSLNRLDCDLSIYLAPHAFSYSIIDRVHNKIVSLCHFPFKEYNGEYEYLNEIAGFLIDEKLIETAFNNTKIAVEQSKSTLIPNELFNPDEIKTYLDFNTFAKSDAIYLSDYIDIISAHNVYAIPLEIVKSLNSFFELPHFYHATTPFIYNTSKENKTADENRLFVNYVNESIQILGLENVKLAFSNTFPVQTKEDFVYFLMAVCEELHFNPEIVKINVYGELKMDHPFFISAQNYLKNLILGSRPKAFKYSKKLDRVPPHQFNHLFSTHVCA